jgi:hypothetical protein
VPRNACIVVRFDDCLDDDAAAEGNLIETVRVLTGYPPSTPYASRVLFDDNHGAIIGGQFHSTRVLVDLTVSEIEAAEMPVPQPVNALGTPSSLPTSSQPNLSVRVPTRIDLGSGQFEILTNHDGIPSSIRWCRRATSCELCGPAIRPRPTTASCSIATVRRSSAPGP